jgi:nucleoside-diphosphate-sugar epimerase
VVVTGAAGFLGTKLASRLLQRKTLCGPDGDQEAIDEVLLVDTGCRDAPVSDARVKMASGDVSDAAFVRGIVDRDTGAIFHLAAVVSSAAEADFDKGLRVNLDATRALLEACRALPRVPRFIFASSLAVYGGEPRSSIDDDTALHPQTSYGAQKACCELLVNDYSRKGFVDGRAPRLPAIVVRPGAPNAAASTWASSIIREPLAGKDVGCPVSPASTMLMMSARRAVSALEMMAEIPGAKLGSRRALCLPGITVSAGEIHAALSRIAGEAAANRIQWAPDAAIQKIVDGWPGRIDAKRARALGIEGDTSIEEIIAAYIRGQPQAQ